MYFDPSSCLILSENKMQSLSSLREKQIQYISRMLTLGESFGAQDQAEDISEQWKILVYDTDCRDIISPLMNVGALRNRGVTLHLLLNSEREAVPDAPAVYFVRPTETNILRICDDCSKQLYRTFYLHFVTKIDRPLLELLAQTLVANNSVGMVSKIYDQYLDIISLEPNLFHLNMTDSFVSYNSHGAGEQQIKGFMSRVSMGILSMIRVLGSVPIIRAPPGGAAEMLANEVCTALRDITAQRGPAQSLFAEALSNSASSNIQSGGLSSRPLLLIFDRTADMIPPLMHTSTYQALIDDLLGLNLNKVTIVSSGPKDIGKSGANKKSYDLNTQTDAFFSQFAGAPFPEAVEANEQKMTEVSLREQEIRSRPGGLQGAAATAAVDINNTKDLSAAIESLPEILSKKANLEAHTSILQATMKEIAARDIPSFFEIELTMATSGRVDKAAVTAILRDGTKGAIQDKARLLAVTALVLASDSSTIGGKFDEFESAFSQGCAALLGQRQMDQAAGNGITGENSPKDVANTQTSVTKSLAAVAFLRRLQSLQGPLSQRMVGGGGAATLTSLFTTAQSRASSLVAKATSFFVKFSPMQVTRISESLAEGRACQENDSYITLDPRKSAVASQAPDSMLRFSEVIVFVIGGGCYSEYFNLMELMKQKLATPGGLRNIYYGCTEIISGNNFLSQLEKLGSP